MARQNVRFSDGNFTSDGQYFYSIIESAQVLQVKVDDGSVAFTFPLDTSVDDEVIELEWDGVHFWSLEDNASTGFIIRKWAIQAFICKQIQKFDFDTGATHTYSSSALTVEHYRITTGNNDNGGSGYTIGLTDIKISDNSMLIAGDVITFVRRGAATASRSGTSFVEIGVVADPDPLADGITVRLTAAMTGDPHGDGKGFRGPTAVAAEAGPGEPTAPDHMYVTKSLWIQNDNSPGVPGTPALYKINAFNGSNLFQISGTQFSNIGGSTFYTTYNTTTVAGPADPETYNTTVKVDASLGGRQTYLLIARSNILLFFNADTNVVDRSLVMNNIKVDTISIWPVFDMVVTGIEPNVVIFRLQLGTTFLNESLVLTDEGWSEYNYEKQLLRRVVNSISVVADPSIIPADGVSSSSITATLRDQYNDLIPSGKQVNFADDAGGNGALTDTQEPTDNFGQAKTNFVAGTTEQDVKITASVVNGLI